MSAIHIKSPALTIKVGPRALARISQNGLSPADVGILPGAAGGPKGIGIQGLDLALFGDWLLRAPRERALIGASIGSWRFASACLPDPAVGIRRLGELYTSQRFAKGVSMAEVSGSCRQMLNELLADQDAAIIANPHYRLLWDANKVSSLEIKCHPEQSGSGLVRPLEPPMIAACKAAIREEISKVTIEINDLRFQVRMTLYSHGSGVFRPFEGRCEALG